MGGCEGRQKSSSLLSPLSLVGWRAAPLLVPDRPGPCRRPLEAPTLGSIRLPSVSLSFPAVRVYTLGGQQKPRDSTIEAAPRQETGHKDECRLQSEIRHRRGHQCLSIVATLTPSDQYDVAPSNWYRRETWPKYARHKLCLSLEVGSRAVARVRAGRHSMKGGRSLGPAAAARTSNSACVGFPSPAPFPP